MAAVEVSLMAGTVSLAARVVSLLDILAVGAVVKAGAVDEDSVGTASVLAEEVGGAGFFSSSKIEVSLRAETALLMTGVVSLEVTLALGIAVEAEVAVEEVIEVATLLADEVETGVAIEEGVVVELLEVATELADVVEAELASMALLADEFNLVIIKEIS